MLWGAFLLVITDQIADQNSNVPLGRNERIGTFRHEPLKGLGLDEPIGTHGDRFQDRRFRPLSHPSIVYAAERRTLVDANGPPIYCNHYLAPVKVMIAPGFERSLRRADGGRSGGVCHACFSLTPL